MISSIVRGPVRDTAIMSAKPIFIYMTCAADEEAEEIVKDLLDRSLIACANIFAPHRSFYNWEGRVENAPEVAVLMKSQADKFSAIEAHVLALHSYECPCLVSWPIERGHDVFMQWIGDNINS